MAVRWAGALVSGCGVSEVEILIFNDSRSLISGTLYSSPIVRY